MEGLINILFSALYSSILLILKLALIILPLTVSYEFVKSRGKHCPTKKLKFLGISGDGLIPLFTGIVVGLTYGAGVIVHSVGQSGFNKKEAFLVLLFLSICHAIIEDTLIFVVIGANGFILVSVRFLLAILLTFLAQRIGEKIPWNGKSD